MRHAELVKEILEESGFTFIKRDEDGHWQVNLDGKELGNGRSLGDLIRKYGNDLGVW